MDSQSVLYATADFHLSYAAEVPCVIMRWRGYHTSASFRAQNEQVLDLLRRHRATKVLCDIRQFLLIGATDQAWLNDSWLPRALDAGLRHCALVTPVYFFNQVAVQSVVDRIDTPVLRVEYFDAAEPARAWLQRADAEAVVSDYLGR
jgi:hypothetical protein